MAAKSAEPVDGRHARSVRTRRAIVDALRALHAEGDLRPTAPRVAERAGVSLRTVWQHFDDLEALFVEGGRVDVEIASAYVAPIDPGLPRARRIAILADQRMHMFEAMAPTWRAARLLEPFSPQIRTNRDRLVDLGREQVAAVFTAELRGARGADRARLLDALHVTTGWALWESLRTELRCEPGPARDVVVRLLTGLLPVTCEETR